MGEEQRLHVRLAPELDGVRQAGPHVRIVLYEAPAEEDPVALVQLGVEERDLSCRVQRRGWAAWMPLRGAGGGGGPG